MYKPFIIFMLLWSFAPTVEASDQLLFLELQGIGGYSSQLRRPVYYSMEPDAEMQKPGIGIDYLKKFSGESGDIASFALQSRFVLTDNGDSYQGEFQVYNAYVKVKTPLSYIWFGHNRPAFGLSSYFDSHSLLLRTLSIQGFGYDRDWGTGLIRDFSWGDIAASATTGSGMPFYTQGNYMYAVRTSYGVLSRDNYNAGFSLGYGKTLDTIGYTLNDPKPGDMKLGGLDLTILWNRFEHRFDLLAGTWLDKDSYAFLFTPIDSKWRIYKRLPHSQPTEPLNFPASYVRKKHTIIEKLLPIKPVENIQTLADQLLLQHFSPAGVLVNDEGDILYTSARTGKYLEPPVGKANWNIFAMVREELRAEFSGAFRKALQQKTSITLHNIRVGTNGGEQAVNVTIQWIEKPEALQGRIMVIFQDIPTFIGIQPSAKKGRGKTTDARIPELELELQRAREDLQSLHEEMETSQEELKSTNEELQSTNEELQSTNEELTTSKEEMQSLNEELQTVNIELQKNVDDFSNVSNDMENLLNSTDIATLFLDKALNIRRFTTQATKIFKLRQGDTGRPFTDLASDLAYPELPDDAREVLRTLISVEKNISARNGGWFNIRIMPYRTLDDRIDGVVITLVDTTRSQKIEAAMRESVMVLRSLIHSSSHVIVGLSSDGKILEFNGEAEKLFGRKREDVLGQDYFELLIPSALQEQVKAKMAAMFEKGLPGRLEHEVKTIGGTVLMIAWSLSTLINESGQPAGLIAIGQNIAAL